MKEDYRNENQRRIERTERGREVKNLSEKLSALTEEKLAQVIGGGPTSTEGYLCTDTNCTYSNSSKCPKYLEKPWLLCPKN